MFGFFNNNEDSENTNDNTEEKTKTMLETMYNEISNRATNIDLQGLMGEPSVFSEYADYRFNTNNMYGDEYVEKFIEEGNFVAFTMGKAKFLPGIGDEGKKTEFLKSITNSNISEEEGDNLKKILDDYESGKIFGFNSTMNEYWAYVNILCFVAAKLLGIDDMASQVFPGKSSFQEVSWGEFSSKFLNEHMSTKVGDDEGKTKSLWQFVPFYNDGIVESSEMMGNMVGNSTLANKINNNPLKQQAAEAAFLTGSDIKRSMDFVSKGKDSSIETMDMGGGFWGNLFNSGKAMLNVNVGLPDIWKDSTYDKTYNIRFKFSTPHGDPLSVFLNVIVPLCHLLPMVTPRTVGFSNTYTTPFIMRIFCKGMINCDMGMATAISINRHQENVSIDGLPTEVSVTMTVKDLYSLLAMPQKAYVGLGKPNIAGILNAQGLMGYLGTLCGFNMVKADVATLISIRLHSLKAAVSPGTYLHTIKRKAYDVAGNVTDSILEKFNLRY